MQKELEAKDVLSILCDKPTVAIVMHIRPDGDSFGSAFCVREIIRSINGIGYVLCDGEIGRHFDFIQGFDDLNVVPEGVEYDYIIAVDCADPTRMGAHQTLASKYGTINIDHHKSNPNFGKFNHVVPNASSTCELVFDIITASGIGLTKTMAEYLYIGLSTDTGNFCHGNTTAKVHRIAAEFIEAGVDTAAINTHIYKSTTLNRTRLKGRAIDNLRLFDGGRIALVSVIRQDLADLGCELSDTEGMIDVATGLRGVSVAIAIAEEKPNVYKVSFRAKHGHDVSAAAGFFGGGGHRAAAGCKVMGKLEAVVDKVVDAARKVMLV